MLQIVLLLLQFENISLALNILLFPSFQFSICSMNLQLSTVLLLFSGLLYVTSASSCKPKQVIGTFNRVLINCQTIKLIQLFNFILSIINCLFTFQFYHTLLYYVADMLLYYSAAYILASVTCHFNILFQISMQFVLVYLLYLKHIII